MSKYYFYWSKFDPINKIDESIIFCCLKKDIDKLFILVSEDGEEDIDHRINLIKISLKESNVSLNKIEILTEDELNKIKYKIGDRDNLALISPFSLDAFKELLNKADITNQIIEDELNKEDSLKSSSITISKLENLDLINDFCLDYISDNHLYYIKPLISLLTPHRLSHSISVAKTAYMIGLANNKLHKNSSDPYHIEKPIELYIAGIVHDIGKSLPKEEQLALMKKNHKDYVSYPSWTYHQFIAIELSKRYYSVSEQVIDAIKYHSTGSANMTLLAEIIYASDKIEPTRDYDSSYLINRCLDDFVSNFPFIVKEVKEFLESKGCSVDNKLSEDFFNKYLKE